MFPFIKSMKYISNTRERPCLNILARFHPLAGIRKYQGVFVYGSFFLGWANLPPVKGPVSTSGRDVYSRFVSGGFMRRERKQTFRLAGEVPGNTVSLDCWSHWLGWLFVCLFVYVYYLKDPRRKLVWSMGNEKIELNSPVGRSTHSGSTT